MDAKTLKGMAVVSLQEGTKLGRVEQLLFDVAARHLGAIEVKGEAGTFIVAFDQIERIGPDAITVASSQVTQLAGARSAIGSLLGQDEIGKLKVVDNAGTFLGNLHAIDFDPETGQITRLTAHKGGVLGVGGTTTPLDAAAILKVGPDLLTVTTDEDAGSSSS